MRPRNIWLIAIGTGFVAAVALAAVQTVRFSQRNGALTELQRDKRFFCTDVTAALCSARRTFAAGGAHPPQPLIGSLDASLAGVTSVARMADLTTYCLTDETSRARVFDTIGRMYDAIELVEPDNGTTSPNGGIDAGGAEPPPGLDRPARQVVLEGVDAILDLLTARYGNICEDRAAKEPDCPVRDSAMGRWKSHPECAPVIGESPGR